MFRLQRPLLTGVTLTSTMARVHLEICSEGTSVSAMVSPSVMRILANAVISVECSCRSEQISTSVARSYGSFVVRAAQNSSNVNVVSGGQVQGRIAARHF